MKSIEISTATELKAEIERLTIMDDEQLLALKHRFSSPSAAVSSTLTLFPKSPTAGGVSGAGFFNRDIISLVSRFALPFTLNRTIFRHSNFLVKMLVAAASQKAAGLLSGNKLEDMVSKVKAVLHKLLHKQAPARRVNQVKTIAITA